jgi:homoserine acetyltransferase
MEIQNRTNGMSTLSMFMHIIYRAVTELQLICHTIVTFECDPAILQWWQGRLGPDPAVPMNRAAILR